MATTKISRTSSSTGNRRTWTFSGWFKKCSIAVMGGLFATYTDSNNRLDFGFDASDKFFFKEKVSSSTNIDFTSTQVFRDTSAFYHLVIAVDTTQSTNTNRVKIYINGEQITSWVDSTYPAEDYDTLMNLTGRTYILGSKTGSADYWNGLMAHVHLVDGTALTPATFGETDSTSGIWKPKTNPSVTYGTNGFFLKFENSGNMDLDSSGNNLTFTTSGTLTQNVDTPSNNFVTMNPLAGNCTFSKGNNTWVGTSSGYEHSSATLGASSGKYYWEVKPTNACGAMGIADPTWQFNRRGSIIYASSSQSYIYEGNGYVSHDSYGDIANNYSTYTTEIIGVALDLDNNKLHFSKGGVWEASSNPATNTNGISIQAPSTLFTGFYTPLVADLCSASAGGGDCNFGNGYFGTTAVASAGTAPSEGGIFEYDCPSGYQALCTKGINSF